VETSANAVKKNECLSGFDKHGGVTRTSRAMKVKLLSGKEDPEGFLVTPGKGKGRGKTGRAQSSAGRKTPKSQGGGGKTSPGDRIVSPEQKPRQTLDVNKKVQRDKRPFP